MNQPRVLLADDHRIVAEGLESLLSPEFELVGTVEDGKAMIAAAIEKRPDVIVADISMPEMNGIDALKQLREILPEAKVVFLTMHQDVAYLRQALEAGASGFVMKHSASTELIDAIHAALQGKIYITPVLASETLRESDNETNVTHVEVLLTQRQRQILGLLVKGHSAKEIANQLIISPRTVEFHKYKMMELLKLQNSAELIHFAIKHNLT